MTESELTSSTMKRCEASEDPDESRSGLESLRESERIIAFTDAVVAVAITLLILPLMEFATGEADSGKEFFRRRGSLLGSFITSFWIIALMWNGRCLCGNQILDALRHRREHCLISTQATTSSSRTSGA